MSKWTYERGVFYPCGDFKLYPTPGKGIFNLVKNPNPMDGRLGLERVADRFEFPYKIYNLGIENFIEKVKKTWTSPYFEKKNQNLGIIFNGLKGTGKINCRSVEKLTELLASENGRNCDVDAVVT